VRLQTLEGRSDWVWSVAFSHDSARLASGSNNSTAKIWDSSSGECLQTLEIGKALMDISFDAKRFDIGCNFGTLC
jgi:WD40 repeat protein